MNLFRNLVLLTMLALVFSFSTVVAEEDITPIPRKIPPQGIKVDQEVLDDLKSKLDPLEKQIAAVKSDRLIADVEIYTKAVRLALQYGEFYKKSDADTAQHLLEVAASRLKVIQDKGKPDWTTAKGLVVRGYRSDIDGSVQPYGLEIPEQLDTSKPVPLYVWLHGRGDKTTDMPFIAQREKSSGKVAPDDAIVLHPFGRQCIGFKSAGEIDVLDAVQHVSENYNIDPDRVVLMGFSMGGAGVWHLGAHYTDRWVAMSPGAGFAETARYTKLAKEDFPAVYEQKLWGQYDVPNYVRNLFNMPVIAYSGEVDKQIQAARVMEEAYEQEGNKLPHLIGPGMGHEYHPDTLADLLAQIKKFRDLGLNRKPAKVTLQTQTLRYNKMHWLTILGLEEHWQDSRVDAEVSWPDKAMLKTKNVTDLRLNLGKITDSFHISIDDQKFTLENLDESTRSFLLSKLGGVWHVVPTGKLPAALAKRPQLQGPIDDAFLAPFLVVIPRAKSENAKIQRWIDFELAHFDDRWQSLFRGKLRWKYDDELTEEDIAQFNLVAWGTPTTNQLIGKTMEKLPIQWDEKQVLVGELQFDAVSHVPQLIYPNPLNPTKYLVINSGPTFREDHDRTNSLQNPKLPDWAVIDISEDPNGSTPGIIAAADFFDEKWQLKK
ncbi:MAG: carboxylesterase family protein [Pirellulales bacterium]